MEKFKTGGQEKELDPRVEAAIALYRLIEDCEKNDVGFNLDYDIGRSIPGAVLAKYGYDAEAVPESEVHQGPKGFRIEVGAFSLTGNDEKEILFPTLGQAVQAGNRILQRVLQGEK